MPSKLSSYINRALSRSRTNLSGRVTGSRRSVVEDIHDGLRICLGSNYAERIEDKLASPDFRGSDEQKCLVRAIESAIADPLRHKRTHHIGDSDPATEGVGAFAGLVDSLRSELEKLSPDDRAILWGKHVEEKPYRDLAKETGLSKSTVHARAVALTTQLLDSLTAELDDDHKQT